MKYIKHIIHKMTSSVKLTLFRIRWIKLNKHNLTRARRIFDINKVSVGMNTYGSLDVKDFGNPSEALKIGNYCSIAEGVKFLLGGEHHCKTVSQYPFNLYISSADQQLDRITKGPIVIDDDVWIGTNAIILSGVHIGQGAVIGAGSVVAKDVPPYAVFAGGRVVKYRFPKEMIDKLLLFDYGKLTNQDVKENCDLLYKNLDEAFFESKLYKKCRRDV